MRFERCNACLDGKGSVCVLEVDHQFEHVGHDGFVWGSLKLSEESKNSVKFRLPTWKERQQDAIGGDVEGPRT